MTCAGTIAGISPPPPGRARVPLVLLLRDASGYGTATFSVDGATVQSMLLSPSTSSPNGQGSGDVLVYTVTGLGAGQHTLKILNKDRKVVYEKTKNPAPEVKATFALGGDSPARAVRRAAMLALTTVRGQEAKTFQSLATFVRIDEGRYMLELPLDPPPERLLAELSAAGASLVSLNPIRDTLEDFFVRHVGVSDTRQLVTSRHDR